MESVWLFPDKFDGISPLDESGKNAQVFRATNKLTGRSVFLKLYPMQAGDTSSALNEPKLLADLSHPNLIKIHSADEMLSETEEFLEKKMLLEMELADGDSYNQLCMKALAECRSVAVHPAIGYAIQACQGLAHMHENQYVHCDVKPANIVIDGGVGKITDLGLARKLGKDGRVQGSKHAFLYRPPEVWLGGGYSVRSDVYQMGVVFYQLLGGQIDFVSTKDMSEREVGQYVVDGKLIAISTLGAHVGKDVRSVIAKCVGDEADRYPTMLDLVMALQALIPRQPNYELSWSEDEWCILHQSKKGTRKAVVRETSRGFSYKIMAMRKTGD